MRTTSMICLGAMLATVCLFFAASAPAEEVTLFQASKAGADAWGWGDAKLKQGKDGLTIQENGKLKPVGDVYVLDRFAYLPDGILEIDVNKVTGGTYSLQVVAFKGGADIGSAELVTEGKSGGKQQFRLGDAKLPAETEMVTFKIWVGGAKGATAALNDLKYTVSIPAEKIAYDKTIDSNTTDAVTDKTSWTASDAGGTIALKSNDPSEAVGSVVLPELMKNPKEGTLLLNVASVKHGNISVQLAAFDANGAYLDSVEVLKKVGAGCHAVRLSQLSWPEGTVGYKVKIWLGGESGSIGSATIKRVMVVK